MKKAARKIIEAVALALLLTLAAAMGGAAQTPAGAAQTPAALPVVTETEALDDLRPLLRFGETRRPLLVNFWATWCGPCRVEFPWLVEIDAEYRARGLDFVIVSLDNFGAKDSRVADFLRGSGSTMPSYLLDLPTRRATDRAIRRIAPRARGGLPLTLLFDARGRLVYQKTGIVDPEILRARIEKTLPPRAAVRTPSADASARPDKNRR